MGKPKVVVVVGPNAAGKSDLAVKLAKKFSGEVVSADSRQVYKGLNIGTGKISKKEMGGVRHHLLDVANPKRQFTVAQYQKLARQKIKEIISRGKLPIICGGTGFYIKALVDGPDLPPVPPNKKLRAELAKKSAAELATILKKLDRRRWKNIDRRNRHRLIRAIEIAKRLGAVPRLKDAAARFAVLKLGVKIAPAELRQKIKKRLDQRLRAGLVEEVRQLQQNRVLRKRLNELGLEYRFICRYLQGALTRPEMLKQLESAIWHYAKRQLTWFKKDKEIKWVKNYAEAGRRVSVFL